MFRLSVVALGLVFAGPAFAKTATNSTQRGDFVGANWSTASSDGCSTNYLYVTAFDGVTHTTGAPTTSDYTFVYYGSYDYCTGSFSFYQGSLDTVSTTVGRHSASLSGSGTLYEYYSGAALPVTVSVSVTDDGYSYRGMSHYKYDTPAASYIFRANGTYAYGSSTIVFNGTTYDGGVYSGEFGTSNSGSLTILE